MEYKLALLASAVWINTIHFLILLHHKGNRKWSISENVILSKNTYLLYVFGHFINGLLSLAFAYSYFVQAVNLPILFVLMLWTVFLENLQAILPAKGRTNMPHTVAALGMWFSFMLLNALCIALLPVGVINKLVASVLFVFLIVNFVRAFAHHEKVYMYQMVSVIFFYASMLILIT